MTNNILFEKKKGCPCCGGTMLYMKEKGFRKGLPLLGVFVAFAESIYGKQTYFVCKKCGCTWEEGKAIETITGVQSVCGQR